MGQTQANQENTNGNRLYSAIWRWHFYAGIIFAPFIMMLAITGGIYLFKPQIESWLYKDFYYIQAGQQKWSPSMQIDQVKKAYPEAEIMKYKPGLEANRSSEVGIIQNGEATTVFVNPYNGNIVGEIKDDHKMMEMVRDLHGELMIGTVGERLIELAACWAMILLVTGIYLWWPRHNKSIFGTLIPRLTQGKRIFWRDLHAVPAFWLTLFIALLIMTGLPWSGVWGDMVNQFATATHTGYPSSLWGDKPESTIPTKQVADVPWAAEKLPVPNSTPDGVTPLSVEKVMQIAQEQNIPPEYHIHFPAGEKGVYTVSARPNKPEDQATLHIDQYSGKILADLRFKDYGLLAKMISIGIALHEGRYFGLFNQIMGLITCMGLIVITASGLLMWWKRKPSNKLGAPPLPKNFKMLKWVGVIVIAFGLFFPLVGVSLLFVLLLDRFFIRRVPIVKEWAA